MGPGSGFTRLASSVQNLRGNAMLTRMINIYMSSNVLLNRDICT
jgi:hypothetical protein